MRARRTLFLASLVTMAASTLADAHPLTLVGYGNSYVNGPFQWVDGAARRLSMTVENNGVQGALSSDTLYRARTTRAPARSTVVVQCSLNDMRRYGSAGLKHYGANLARILVTIRRRGAARRIIVVLDSPIVAWARYAPFDRGSDRLVSEYNRVTIRVARRHGALVANPRPGWNRATMVAGDGIHPNELGDEHIADAVISVVRRDARRRRWPRRATTIGSPPDRPA